MEVNDLKRYGRMLKQLIKWWTRWNDGHLSFQHTEVDASKINDREEMIFECNTWYFDFYPHENILTSRINDLKGPQSTPNATSNANAIHIWGDEPSTSKEAVRCNEHCKPNNSHLKRRKNHIQSNKQSKSKVTDSPNVKKLNYLCDGFGKSMLSVKILEPPSWRYVDKTNAKIRSIECKIKKNKRILHKQSTIVRWSIRNTDDFQQFQDVMVRNAVGWNLDNRNTRKKETTETLGWNRNHKTNRARMNLRFTAV